jgi:hypothetical protein
MMKRKGKSIWLVVILLFSFIVIVVELPQKASAYTPHDPIEIDGDSDFANGQGMEPKIIPILLRGMRLKWMVGDGVEIQEFILGPQKRSLE